MHRANFEHSQSLRSTSATELSFETILPEFYSLSCLEREIFAAGVPYPTPRSLESPSVELSSRATKNKHDNIVRLRNVETKKITETLHERVLHTMRIAHRESYRRGHLVPAPGQAAIAHPRGSSPVVLRNTETGSRGRNASPGTSRPRTALEVESTNRFSPNRKSFSRASLSDRYSRSTAKRILGSSGFAIPQDVAKSTWVFKYPLNSIEYSRPSTGEWDL